MGVCGPVEQNDNIERPTKTLILEKTHIVYLNDHPKGQLNHLFTNLHHPLTIVPPRLTNIIKPVTQVYDQLLHFTIKLKGLSIIDNRPKLSPVD